MCSLVKCYNYNDIRPTRVGNHPATVLETFGCWPRFSVCLNLFDLSDVVNITCIVHYGIEIKYIHTYIHTGGGWDIYEMV